MSKRFIETLYDAAKTEDDNGLSKLDEQKLRRHLEGNKTMFGKNRDMFSQNEPKYHTCSLYNPCPLCDKCLNKASHLYVRCQNCEIPICVHTYKDRAKMIKRRNFRCPVTKEVYEEIEALADKVINGE